VLLVSIWLLRGFKTAYITQAYFIHKLEDKRTSPPTLKKHEGNEPPQRIYLIQLLSITRQIAPHWLKPREFNPLPWLSCWNFKVTFWTHLSNSIHFDHLPESRPAGISLITIKQLFMSFYSLWFLNSWNLYVL